ncbi:AraC family ligand binding domain-containing protein [Phyllobacterium chamaecytisi]|uniref:AraC family ligand binding domain-containing protein n=1 Tax=Phyllobacterium chamaecytisi TaxID=2876082 RepID=UPI001CCC9A19|nr:AraC family ligand binding domain-containing protein [Phyllobacterium sp. KW56]
MVESTKIWRTDGLNAEFLRGRFIDFSYAMHTHDKICLSLITDGAIRIRMRGQEFTARKGDLYAIDADVPHAGSPVDGEGWSLRTLYVDFDAVNEWVCDNPYHSQTRSISGPIIRDPLLTDMFSGLHVHAERAALHWYEVRPQRSLQTIFYRDMSKSGYGNPREEPSRKQSGGRESS